MKNEDLKKLVDKIQSMTAKEIVLTMVDSLRNPVTKIDMGTFGFKDNDICYGCAATNTICKLGGFDPLIVLDEEENRRYRDEEVNDTAEILEFKFVVKSFEWAIDALRSADLYLYNDYACGGNFSEIIDRNSCYLPLLDSHFTEKDLKCYEDFANTL